MEISKRYEPNQIQEKWYQHWVSNKYFKVDVDVKKKPFTIMMPPPNVTGVLHMGHALQDSIQDCLIRYKRMKGFNAHWQAGKDHAGLATQNVVEKRLRAKGIHKDQLGREKFLEEVWKVVENHRDVITKQKIKLGDSADWDREKFTLDGPLYDTVMHVFEDLYNKGLIYKGKYIVNWCPRCHTALSNEEVEYSDKEGKLWYIRYPYAEGDGELIVATTRPETMFGDTGVAVGPKDDRFKNVVGKKVVLPLMNREIPVFEDFHVDKEFGTGAVKITPAHDPNDFEMGNQHELERIVVIDTNGIMNENVPEKFQGLSREECREKVIEELDKHGYLVKVEDYSNSVGECSRCKTSVEPYLSDQWYVKMKPLAEKAIKAMKEGEMEVFPPRWEKTYFDWLENIRDWCISRQLWWGHRIPVYYCECGEEFVSAKKPDVCPKCRSKKFKQDEDVLDTWFSSWLWPFSTLGWMQGDDEFDYFYNTDVLVSGYDIIFFWVIRMVIAGLEFTGKVPFKDIYLTGLIRDKHGRKMSKSLGNGIDPIDMVNQYGADAVRFTLCYLSTEGQDINLDPKKFEMGRNFANKLWNVFRYSYQYIEEFESDIQFNGDSPSLEGLELDSADKWILSRLMTTIKKVDDYYDRYKVQYITYDLYHFIWDEFCDWYIELSKVTLFSDNTQKRKNKALVLNYLLDSVVKILHPFMPFITEEIWSTMPHVGKTIMHSKYPKVNEKLINTTNDSKFEMFKELVIALRNIRGELNIKNKKEIETIVVTDDNVFKSTIKDYLHELKNLVNVCDVKFASVTGEGNYSTKVLKYGTVNVNIDGLIDIDQEKQRIEKELTKLNKELEKHNKKLNNEQFLAKAKPEAVEKAKQKQAEVQEKVEGLENKLNELS